jgi:hypothetical protein
MVELLLKSPQMDLRYCLRHRINRLGIWINVNVYPFLWINVKSFIEHLFVFL